MWVSNTEGGLGEEGEDWLEGVRLMLSEDLGGGGPYRGSCGGSGGGQGWVREKAIADPEYCE